MNTIDFPLLLLPYVFAVVILVWISSFAYQRRKQAKEARSLFILSLCVILWIVAYVLAQITKDVQTQFFWYQWVRVGVVFSSVMVLVFALRHSHRDQRIQRVQIALGVPNLALISMLVVQMVQGHLLGSQIIQDPEELGLVGNLVLIYGSALSVGAAFILGRAYFEGPSSLRWQGVALVLGILMPVVISLQTDIIGYEWIPNFDEATFSLVFTAIIFAWIIFRQQLLNIWPVAYETILHNIHDGVIILNTDALVMMINPTGEVVLGQTSKDVIGKPFRPLAAQLGMGEIILEGLQEKTVEFSRWNDSQVMYQMKISALRDKNGRIVGSVLLIYDVSDWKRSQQRLTDLATIDFLTGIYNRQHFIYLAQQEIFHCANDRKPCSIILVDVDHFKTVNDNYGHQVGDQVLKHIVNMCRNSLRRADIMGRYGGEEFIILLPETQLEGVQLVAERVRMAVSQSPYITPRENIPVSVSLGVAVGDAENFCTLEKLLEKADHALYAAKNGGRNCVSVYSD